MAKRIGTTQGKVPIPEKTSVGTRKRTKSLPEEEKQNSPVRVTGPLKEQEATAASEEELEDSGTLNLPETFSKPKKVFNFRNLFPESARSCRPGTDYSEDDDDNSIEIKDREIELVNLKMQFTMSK